MPPPTPNATDLTEVERTYLRSCIVNYRSTPPAEKEGFRDNCVKYIMRQCTISDTDPYVLQLIRLKVKNWFQNHAKKGKTVRLPMRVNQGFSAMRVWALLNDAAIRKSVGERKEAAHGEDLAQLATWNEAKRQLWEGLPEADRRAYEKLAEKWTLEGPDEAVKPILATKRAPGWMRSVIHLFWTQCNMALFMYGMYKDKDGVLHAAVYDTSNLWKETNKSMPLFRNVPAWDQDFRRVIWTFFQAILCPELAALETLQVLKASKRQPPAPISFSRHPDQCPILFKSEGDGKEMINSRRQEIFREFIKAHYSTSFAVSEHIRGGLRHFLTDLAVGRETRSAPWGSLRDRPLMFFEDGMLPAGFVFNDPSHISEVLLIPFFEHVIAMENPPSPDVPARRFRFYQFEKGSGDNRTYHPAVYNGIVEAAPPRRTKKPVTVPEFMDPPSPIISSSPLDGDADDSPLPHLPKLFAPLATTLASDLEAARAEVRAEMAAEPNSPAHVLPPALPAGTPPGIAAGRSTRATTSKPRQPMSTIPWLDAEIDAAAHASDSESELTEDEYSPPTDDDAEDSYDEVEDVLNDLDLADTMLQLGCVLDSMSRTDDAVTGTTSAGITSMEGTSRASPPADGAHASPLVGTSSNSSALHHEPTPVDRGSSSVAADLYVRAAPFKLPLHAPATVRSDAPSRLEFLTSLSTEAEYIHLLHRMDHALGIVVRIRAQNPVFWGTWGYTSAHVPEAVHTTENKAAQLLKWICKDRHITDDAIDVQRFCLVVGMCLRDLALIGSSDGTAGALEIIPGFLARSCLEADTHTVILQACAKAFTMSPPVGRGGAAKGKGKGKGRETAPKDAPCSLQATSGISSAQETTDIVEPPAPRRSQRAAARRT